MPITRFRNMLNSSDRDLRVYIRFLIGKRNKDINKISSKECITLHSLSTSQLKEILTAEVSLKLRAKHDDLSSGEINARQCTFLSNLITEIKNSTEASVNFEESLLWAMNNTRAQYFLYSMLRLAIISKCRLILYPACYILYNQNSTYPAERLILREILGANIHPADLKYSKIASLHGLIEIQKRCPNNDKKILSSPIDSLESIGERGDGRNQQTINGLLNSIERLFYLVSRKINTDWEMFTTKDDAMINWLYNKLNSSYSSIALRPTEIINNKKKTILHIIDVIYITHEEKDFNLKMKSLRDEFSRMKKLISTHTISIDDDHWEKLILMTRGSKSKAKIQKQLYKLIDENYDQRRD